jgi:pimeloyl-ACP methyl ester carboxylesterase
MRWLKGTWLVVRSLLAVAGTFALIAVAAIAYPLRQPPELPSIHAGAVAIDHSAMPDPVRFQARDGTNLAYRLYPGGDDPVTTIAIVIHGSAGHSAGMNQIAKRLVAEHFTVVSPDIRGHGESGTRGDIGYGGELDDDLEDLVGELRRLYPQARFSLLGFSAGGGFALRVAAGKLSSDFDRLILLSPYLGYDAPTSRASRGSALWASADIPRFIGLAALRRLGMTCCESLPAIAFALPARADATREYSFRLLTNFAAPPDLGAAFRALKMRTTIIAGSADELMYSDKYADIVRGISPPIDVKIVSGLGHMDMLHKPAAIDAIAASLKEE